MATRQAAVLRVDSLRILVCMILGRREMAAGKWPQYSEGLRPGRPGQTVEIHGGARGAVCHKFGGDEIGASLRAGVVRALRARGPVTRLTA